jgi:hypothetical protein
MVQVPTQVVLFICSHYIIRKFCEGLSLLSFSVRVFRSYFANLWTLFDMLTIAMTMAAIIWNDNNNGEYRGGWNAFVTGLLWIKVLGFLKVVNQQMATFIMALSQILKDLRFFMVVLLVMIFMFGDMMNIALTSKDNGEYCWENPDLEGPAADFCSPKRTDSYLRM